MNENTLKRIYVLLLLGALAAALLLEQRRNCDFYAYYSALTWSAQSGRLPYQRWNGKPEAPPDSELGRYALERWDRPALRFLYPPSAIPQLLPFTWIPWFEVAAMVWSLFNVATLVAIVALARDFAPRQRGFGFLLLLAVAYGPLRMGMWLGQVSLWVAFLLMLFVWALRRDRGFLAGFALGLAISLKVFPILWAPALLLYPGQTRRCLAGGAGALALSVALATSLYGWDAWRQYHELILSRLSLYPPRGTISLYAYLGFGQAATAGAFESLARRGLFWLMYLPAVTAIAWRRPRTASRKFRALLLLTIVIHLAMPLTWAHYLAFFGVLLSIEISRLVPHNIRRFPATVCLLATIFFMPGLWLTSTMGLTVFWQSTQLSLLAGLLIPAALSVDSILWRKRHVSYATQSVAT